MSLYALRLTSRRVPGERVFPVRFDNWQEAAQLVRSLSNDLFWKHPYNNSGHICGPYGDDFVVSVPGVFLRVVSVPLPLQP
jgi:hypothetical protein